MKSKDLGLPIEYQQYPQFFDSPDDINTNKKNVVIELLLNKYNVKTVLDMTCGTGAQVFYLAKLGYQVIGADFSPGLIAQAKQKALAYQVAVEFIDGDMRTLQVGEFDAVITIDNAIGHLVQADFEQALNTIAKNLKPGGLYVFDILNLDAMTDEVVQADSQKMSDKKLTMDGTELYTSRRSSIDRIEGYITSEESILICRGQEQKKIQNTSSLKIYTPAQLKSIVSKHGFLVLEQHKVDAYTFEYDDSGYSILTVAQKL